MRIIEPHSIHWMTAARSYIACCWWSPAPDPGTTPGPTLLYVQPCTRGQLLAWLVYYYAAAPLIQFLVCIMPSIRVLHHWPGTWLASTHNTCCLKVLTDSHGWTQALQCCNGILQSSAQRFWMPLLCCERQSKMSRELRAIHSSQPLCLLVLYVTGFWHDP